jgi:molecular chaperone IbpA
MTRITSLDLTPFYRNSVGVDRLFDRINKQLESAASGNYPPYDIVRTGDETYEIRLAVAGFSPDEIDIEFHEGSLTVRSQRDDAPAAPEVQYLHHGISNRDFVRCWTLGEYVEVRNATFQDGILTVGLERIVPESQKPRKIAISNTTAAIENSVK